MGRRRTEVATDARRLRGERMLAYVVRVVLLAGIVCCRPRASSYRRREAGPGWRCASCDNFALEIRMGR